MTSLVSQARIVCLFCKYCGMSMRLSGVEPSLTPEHDRITYECAKCGHSLIKEVSSRYLPERTVESQRSLDDTEQKGRKEI